MSYEDVRGEATAEVWLFLLKRGGRWVSSEVAKGTAHRGPLVGQLLSAMNRNGSVRQFELAGKKRRFSYGVTGTCKVPRCVTMSQIAECVLATPLDGEEQP